MTPTSDVCRSASSRLLLWSLILFLRASKRRPSSIINSSSCSPSSSPTSFNRAEPVLLRRSISGRWSAMFCLCSWAKQHRDYKYVNYTPKSKILHVYCEMSAGSFAPCFIIIASSFNYWHTRMIRYSSWCFNYWPTRMIRYSSWCFNYWHTRMIRYSSWCFNYWHTRMIRYSSWCFNYWHTRMIRYSGWCFNYWHTRMIRYSGWCFNYWYTRMIRYSSWCFNYWPTRMIRYSSWCFNYWHTRMIRYSSWCFNGNIQIVM